MQQQKRLARRVLQVAGAAIERPTVHGLQKGNGVCGLHVANEARAAYARPVSGRCNQPGLNGKQEGQPGHRLDHGEPGAMAMTN